MTESKLKYMKRRAAGVVVVLVLLSSVTPWVMATGELTGGYEVHGSATGESTVHDINYDVNETGNAFLTLNGQGDRLGPERTDAFYDRVDNASWTWSAGEIPRNATARIIGQGEKFGPAYNKSFTDVNDESNVYYDLDADDYKTNVTLVGAGQRNGTLVEKGPFRAQGDGDQKTVTFDHDQNNESVVFTGNTTTEIQNTTFAEDFSTLDAYESGNVTVENGKLGLDTYMVTYDDFTDSDIGEYNGDTAAFDVDSYDQLYPSNADRYHNRIYRSDTGPERGDSFAVRMRVQSGQMRTGFIFGFQDPDNFYIVNLDGQDGTMELVKWSDGTRNVLDETPTTSSDVTGTINITYGELTLTAEMNGNTVSADDSEYAGGSMGWNVWFGKGVDTDPIAMWAESEQLVKNGYTVHEFTTAEVQSLASLNWSAEGSTSHYVSFGDPTGWTEWTTQDEWKDLQNGTDVYVKTELSKSAGDGPSVGKFHVATSRIVSTQTHNPAIDIDGDETNETSYTGTLSDGESVVIDLSEDVTTGTQTWTIHTSQGVADWAYQGNNEARAHVKNVSVNGVSYTVDQYLPEGQTTTIPVDNADTLIGENTLKVDLYENSETQYVSRADASGQYEGRSVVSNLTVNGETHQIDETLAAGESATVDITGGYGENTLTVNLKENSTQNKADAELVWNPENRSYVENVTIDGTTYTVDKFLASGENHTINVTESINSGSNTHTFYQHSEKTLTDTVEWTEEVETEKDVSVTISENRAYYNETSVETFDKAVDAGATFNFTLPDRTTATAHTTVLFNDSMTVLNSTSVSGDNVTVTVEERIPKDTEVTVKLRMEKWAITGADETLESASGMDSFELEFGLENPEDPVTFDHRGQSFTEDKWEVIDTGTNAEVDFEVSDGDIVLSGEPSGFTVHRPKHSTATWAGVTNVIHPTEQLASGEYVTHDPLYAESDETYLQMTNYSVSGVDSPVEVVWNDVSGSHLQWTTDTQDPSYVHTVHNVTSDGVHVLADGERYDNWNRTGTDVNINVSGDTTWDVFTYDNLTITTESVSVVPGETKTVDITVKNPNNFAVHNVRVQAENSWVTDISPAYQTIPAGETETFEVTIHVPAGTQETTYDLGMAVASSETGEVNTDDITVDVSGGVVVGGTGIPTMWLFAGLIVLLVGLVLFQLRRTGGLQDQLEEV